MLHLKKIPGDTKIIRDDRNEVLNYLGVELTEISKEDQKRYNVSNGVKVTKINAGRLRSHTSVREGFVIISVNKQPVTSVDTFLKIIRTQQGGGVMLEGKYSNDPTVYYYAFGY
ncbi:MAG: hypothetical protein Q8891_07785 [Bacteroidota bacterium]|nr:hypothetical protein [Bacteroidota bacterium]